MAKVAESVARAGGVATARRRRSELAIQINAATKSRRNEVQSLLTSLKGSRERAGREQSAEMRKATRARHGDIRTLLANLKTSRRSASREYQREANATNNAREAEVSAVLTQFSHERAARQRLRLGLAAALRRKAAAFMRDLTSGVAALRDGFAKEGRDRAVGIRGRLLAYGHSRRAAIAVWRESLSRGRSACAESGETARHGRGSK